MRRLLLIALAVVIILGLGVWGALQSQSFWRWGGWQVVNFAQDRLKGELKVGSVQGYPLTGFTFTDVTLTWSKGEILHADRLDLRFSLWSFFRLQPVIADLTLHDPRFTLRQDAEGRWEVAHILKKRPPPPFNSLDFRQIRVLHGQVQVIRPAATQRYQDLDFNLALTVLHPKRPNQEILVRRADLSGVTPLGPFALTTSLTYAHNQLKIDSLDIRRGRQALASLTGKGGFGPREKALFSINVGPISGTVMHLLWPKWPRDWEVKGNFRLGVLGLSRFAISGAGRVQQASFDLHGTIDREASHWTYDLDAKVAGLRPELLAPFNPNLIQKVKDLSPVAASLTLKGTGLAWPPEQMDWTLDAAPFRTPKARIEQLKVNLTGNPQAQNLQCRTRGNFGELSLTAAGPLLTARKGDLKLQTKDFQPARLGLEKAGETNLSGKFSGVFSFAEQGGLSGLKLTGDLEARGRLVKEPLEDLRARLVWQRPKLEVPKASLRLGPLAADLSGSIVGDRLAWKFKGSLAPEAARPYLAVTTRSRLELSGDLTGTFRAPHFSLQGGGQGLALNGVSLKSFTFKTNGTGWPPAVGDLEVRGLGLSTPAGTFSQAALSCRGARNLWQLHFTAGAPREAQAEMQGTADLRTRPISLLLQKFAWHSPQYHIANTGPVQLRLIPGLQLVSGSFKVNDGDLALRLAAQGPHLSGQLSLHNFPAKIFSLRGPPLKGVVDGTLTASGEPGAPLIRGKVNWSPGQVGDFPFQTMQASFDFHGGYLYLTGHLDQKTGGPSLGWDGKIPLYLSLIPLKWSLGDQNLTLNVKGKGTSLALLTAIPAVQAAGGELNFAAQWQGNPHHPQVSGQIRWGAGSIKLRAAGALYRLLPGEAHLQGTKITIPNLTLESGGALRLSGGLSLDGFTPGQIELRGEALNFIAIRKEGTQVEANGNVALLGPWKAARLTGRILIPRATFATSFFQPGPPPDIILINQPAAPEKKSPSKLAFWKNLQMDLALQSAGEIWIKGKDINVDMQGSLKVIKASGQEKMAIAGIVRAVKGTLEVQGRTFKVSEGSVILPGKPRVPGTLAGRAISQVGDTTLFLDISGPTSKPALRFSSNPPLPPQDLLSYLLFGRPSATLNREEYNAVNQQALGVFGGLTAGKIKDILGKDFPLTCDITMHCGEQSVGVTKPITEKLSVGFVRNNNPLYREDTNQAQIEYKVNKYLSVQSTLGRRNTGGDVLFNHDF
jgi:translocation and assembly module TamB